MIKTQPCEIVDPESRQWKYDDDEHRDWYRFNKAVLEFAPRLCPSHLPVFGVVEESRDA